MNEVERLQTEGKPRLLGKVCLVFRAVSKRKRNGKGENEKSAFLLELRKVGRLNRAIQKICKQLCRSKDSWDI